MKYLPGVLQSEREGTAHGALAHGSVTQAGQGQGGRLIRPQLRASGEKALSR